jgi:hypothetical protein
VTDEQKPRLVRKVSEMLDAAGIAPEGDEEKPKRTKRRKPKPDISISITGAGAHQVAGRDLYDQSTRVEKLLPPPVVVKTGDGVLDAQQKARLHALVNEAVSTSDARRAPRVHQQVWAQLNRYMGVNAYAEIRGSDFEKAAKFLRRMSAIDNSMPSARKKNPDWRRKRIAAIHARCKERGWEEWRAKYMKEKFGRESMVDMPDSEIETLYRAVMGKK